MEGLLAQAAETINLTAKGQFAGLGSVTIAKLISAVIGILLVVAALIFFFMLLWGGIRYITSGGDKGQTEAARNQITAALIGLVIVFAAWAIVNLASNFLGINLLQLNIQNIQSV